GGGHRGEPRDAARLPLPPGPAPRRGRRARGERGHAGHPRPGVTLALARVDDRLIHGQVVIGWGRPLGASFVVLVDDAVRASEWEQELYRLAAPPEVEVIFASVAEAAAALPAWTGRADRGILLTADVATMADLHDR